MKCQILFSSKNEKINIISLSSAEFALSMISVKMKIKAVFIIIIIKYIIVPYIYNIPLELYKNDTKPHAFIACLCKRKDLLYPLGRSRLFVACMSFACVYSQSV